MLTRSFCCFRGLSVESERRFWRAGCRIWTHLPRLAHRLVSARKAAVLMEQIPVLRAALDGGVADFFLRRLPVGYRVRALPDFVAGVGYLDIETSGLERNAAVTVIGLSVGGRFHQFVRGRDFEELLRVWHGVKLVVTFNGAAFDLPRVAGTFGLTVLPPHIDLCSEARVHGLTGGLKEIERVLGVDRSEEEHGDGAAAATWWRQHIAYNDRTALDKLLRYNRRDVLSLHTLAERLLERSMEGYPGPFPILSGCSAGE